MSQDDLNCTRCFKRLVEINGKLYCKDCDSEEYKEAKK